jgi:hypothetical protein
MVIAFYRTRYFVNSTPCTTGLTGADVESADWEEEGSLCSMFVSFSASCVWRAGTMRPGFRILTAEASFRRLVT